MTVTPNIIAISESALSYTRVGQALAQDIEGYPYMFDKVSPLLHTEFGILNHNEAAYSESLQKPSRKRISESRIGRIEAN